MAKMKKAIISYPEWEMLTKLSEKSEPAPFVEFVQHGPLYSLMGKKLAFRKITYPSRRYEYSITEQGRKVVDALVFMKEQP